MNTFETNFALMQFHKYSLTEIEGMVPWERQIYISLLLKHLQEEKEKLSQQGGGFSMSDLNDL